MKDLLFSVRSLARTPGFTALVVLTLALGIGATTVVFDLFNVFYWRKPAIERPNEVVQVYTTHPQAFVGPYGAISWPDFVDYREAATTASELVAYRQTWTTMDVGDGSEEAEVYQVTGDFFETLGLRAPLGRPIGAEDDRPSATPVAVIGHSLFERLGGSADVLGQEVKIGGTMFQVVGVLAPGFRGLTAGSDLKAVISAENGLGSLGDLEDAKIDRTLQAWNVLARLPRRATADDLEAELDVVAARLDAEHELPNVERDITVEPIIVGHPVDQLRLGKTLYVFGAAVGLLILIACANVSNLLLARALGRRREMGIRQSIGASRSRLIRQLLTESLTLALAGGAAGLLLAVAVRRMMASYFGPEIVSYMTFDQRVLGLTLAVSMAVTLIFGLAPALVTSRVDLVTALKDALPSGSLRRRLQAKSLLATLQIALALVLLVCCGLLFTDLWQARSLDLGFESNDLLVAAIELPPDVEPEEGRAFFTEMRTRVASVPGVASAGTALLVPPVFLDVQQQLVLPEDPETVHRSRFNITDADYFEALGLRLDEGRLFESQDAQTQGPGSGHGVVVVNRRLADELWPGESALGRTVRVVRTRPGDPGSDYEVVGVVSDVVQFARSTEKEPAVYFSWAQRYRPLLRFVVRTDGSDPNPIFAAFRDELRRLDPTLSLYRPMTHQALRWESLVDRRLQTQTVSLFGGVGLFLALLGVFGVVSYTVSQQVREIGIRIAVGARRADVLSWVLRRGMGLALAGATVGLFASFWAVRLLRGAVPGLGEMPPSMVIGATLVLLVAAAASVWLPARRASRIDPLRALRSE